MTVAAAALAASAPRWRRWMLAVLCLWLSLASVAGESQCGLTPPVNSDEECGASLPPVSDATDASTTDSSATASWPASLRPRRSSSRGHANHGWLNSYHTFSFASYSDPQFNQFHSLRVINEDRVRGGAGFGEHPHSDFEIFSYVVRGALRHKDSLGHEETIPRGGVQQTSAGRGISHSEYNDSPTELVHFLQLWVKPTTRGLQPSYETKHFSDEEKDGKLMLILSPLGSDGSIVLHAPVKVYASLLRSGASVSFVLRPNRAAYLHLVQDVSGFDSERDRTALIVDGGLEAVELRGGDGLFIERPATTPSDQPVSIRIRSSISEADANADPNLRAEFILFDLSTRGNL